MRRIGCGPMRPTLWLTPKHSSSARWSSPSASRIPPMPSISSARAILLLSPRNRFPSTTSPSNPDAATTGTSTTPRQMADSFSSVWLAAAGIRSGGKLARQLLPGDVVNIPANVKHWHGAARDSWFAHLAMPVPGENVSNEWLEPVNDKEYDSLK